MKLIAVLAMDTRRCIGKAQGLPWNIPEDLAHFRRITLGQTVLMGHNTYWSLPQKFRPLPARRNIVITRDQIEGVETFPDIDTFFSVAGEQGRTRVYLIGGAHLYNRCFSQNRVDEVALTLLSDIYEGDIFVDEFRENFTCIEEVPFGKGTFQTLIHH